MKFLSGQKLPIDRHTLKLEISQLVLSVKKHKKSIPEMLYFHLKMHQNVLGGRALSAPARGAYSAPRTLVGFKGQGKGPGTELERGEGERGRGGKQGKGKSCHVFLEMLATLIAVMFCW